jgi:hypothetical protein
MPRRGQQHATLHPSSLDKLGMRFAQDEATTTHAHPFMLSEVEA